MAKIQCDRTDEGYAIRFVDAKRDIIQINLSPTEAWEFYEALRDLLMQDDPGA